MTRGTFIAFFILLQTLGQEIKFENFTVNNGLSNNSVRDIENDVNGGLWIATWDGLNYFDGYTFTVFKNDIDAKNSIAGNFITKIKRDAKNRIWIITEDAKISRYIGNKKFKNYTFKEIPKNISISKNGNALVCTTKDCYEFIDGQFIKTKQIIEPSETDKLKKLLLNQYPHLFINDVLKDQTGNIWYATRKNGLFIIKNKLDKSNTYHIENYVKDPYSSTSFNSNEIETLHEDLFGNIWLGAKDGGICMGYSNSDKILSVAPHPIEAPNIPNETLRAITKDIEGKLWLGYYTKGLYSYNAESKNYKKFNIKEANHQPDWKRIRSLFTASDGTIWAGTYAGIIRIQKNGSYLLYKAKDISNLPNNRNYSIYEDNHKQLWIACWGGVAKFNLISNRFEAFKGQELLTKYHIRNLKFLDNELILATENHGVQLLDVREGKLNKITVQKDLSNYHKEDKNVTTNSKNIKLIDIKNGELQTINTNKGLLSNSIYAVYKDKTTGYYWLATLGGLSIYDKEKGIIKNITEKEGLPSQLVYGILTNNKEVWISTTKGIAVINKNTFLVKAFYPKGGWQVSEFSEGAYYKDAKGDLYFGGINGLNYFNPNNIQFNNAKAKLKLLVDYNENFNTNIVKSHNHNHIDIDLVPIRFPIKVEKNIYYKLEGKDHDWILLNVNNEISYSNLIPGNYNFLVKEGKNSKTKLLFSLQIQKPFYQTALFYVLLSLLILIGAIIIIYVKNKAAIAQKKKLEAKIIARTKVIENQKKDLQLINSKLDEKNKEIVQQKEKLLALHNNLKNEDFELEKFKTFVLSEFQEPVSQIIKKANALSEDSDHKKSILQQSNQLVTLISEWNYLSHIKDIGAIKTSAIHLLPVLKNNIHKLEKSLHNNKVDFNFTIDAGINWVEVDVLRFRLMLQYLFNDISKYSDAGSKLEVNIYCKNAILSLEINSNSSLLINNWYSVSHYSPYFKALQTLLLDLQGRFINHNLNSLFKITVQVPINSINIKEKQTETISWKHFNTQENLANNKKNVLVFSDEGNFATANQILAQSDYNLIFENLASNLNSATKQIPIQIIVLYQVNFSKELLYFINNSSEIQRKQIPMIYISEDINYELREQSIEFGIDSLVQLPASESFIQKKMESLINKKHISTKENQFQQKIFDILTDKDQVLTANDKLLKKSLEIIKKEIHNPVFNVEMLVDLLAISRVKCYRLFKERLKQSPSDVIMSLRLQKAEALLKTNKLNISEISFECGYNDPKYFAKTFKKHFGKSPKEFKQQFY
ncbi:AraC family transcriptional regulator [Polaribacter reichenbachii]|uniref:AraC family transcriptional regulator n=1 Tax=Polaribacter reichenbachii TaxID=996801 RepID=A0A1B8U4D3_9FLAO|nr:two-component regulator propeller domain-containing protein [Polaribacter reichenbachii]APZ47444.1 AraC family transcriptional regulator [Polaribacter reichenbachii]AUC18083.1 AraC family transcriptional regulator [Polaribacter reichenbachii]OBY66694.1 AraC family transcriptional regulator [Polaribacter reichenbachii]